MIPPSPDADLEPGQTVGEYQVEGPRHGDAFRGTGTEA